MIMATIYRVRSFTTEKERGNNKSYTHNYYNTRYFTSKRGANKAFKEEDNIIGNKTHVNYSNLIYLGGRVVMEEVASNSDGELVDVKSVLKEKLYGDSIPYSTR